MTTLTELDVLIAEDDTNIAAGLADLLRGEGYRVTVAADGRQALEAFRRAPPDIVLLDIMMPHVNGYDVCREIRRTDARAAILFLSAKSEEIDRVIGLELGADDFINKPFGVKEVLARIRAVSRRCLASRPAPAPDADGGAPQPFRIGDLDVYPAELRARRAEATIDLSLRDVRILALLHREAGRVVDRDHFFRVCWGLDHLPNSRTLDQHISKLRRRIERDPEAPVIIRTVHGVGYRHEA
jgi:DNA-binding response OmpR family regulator